MRSIALTCSLSLLCGTFLSGAAFAQSAMPAYTSIWNVGDSLSDTGRTYERTANIATYGRWISLVGSAIADLKAQPYGSLYYAGRFSNGKVWVEYLNADNGLVFDREKNHAWGGAVAGTHEKWAYRQVLPTLGDEIGTVKGIIGDKRQESCTLIFFNCETRTVSGAPLGSNTLLTLWIGGNDFRQEIEDADSPDLKRARQAILNAAVPGLRTLRETISARGDAAGTKMTFYVGTVPDIATTPKGVKLLSSERQTELSGVIRETNRELKRQIYEAEGEFTAKNARLVVFDAAALLAEVQRNPAPFGFKEKSLNCVDADSGDYVNGCSAANVGDFLFWDQFHPTTKAHQMIAHYAETTDKLEYGAPATLSVPYVANIEIRDRTFAGSIGGSGSLIKQGETMLTLAGNNSYSGGTRIDGGLIRITSDANLGAAQGMVTLQGGGLRASESITMAREVHVNRPVSYGQVNPSRFGATFVVDADKTLTLQGSAIRGSGDIAKDGLGTLDLRSNVTDARALTEVKAGLLKVNAATPYRSTTVTVNQAGALGGAGTIVGTVVNHGRLEPGNSVGTLTIVGDLVKQGGGTYGLDVGSERADNLVVTGSVTLGGDIEIATERRAKITDQSFTILQAGGPVLGRYGEVRDLSPFLSETLSYGPSSVAVTFRRDFAAPALTANQQAVARHLNDAYRLAAQGDLDEVFHALDNTVTDAAGARALDQLSGRSLGNLLTAGAIQRGQVTRALEDRLAARRSGRATESLDSLPFFALGDTGSRLGQALRDAPLQAQRLSPDPVRIGHDGVSTWARVLGGPSELRGAGGFTSRGAGVMAGLDKSFGSTLLGISLGYGHADTTNRDSGKGRADSYQISLYGSLHSGNLFLDGTLGYAYSDYATSRVLDFGGLSRVAAGSPEGHDVSLSFKAGGSFGLAGWTVEPSLGFDWYRLNRSGFAETLAGSAGLVVASETMDLVLASGGIRLGTVFDLGSFKLSPELTARYYYNAGDSRPVTTAGLIGAPALPFKVETAGLGRHLGVISAGLTAQQSESLQVFGRYDLTLADKVTAHAFSAGLKYTW